MGIVEKYKRRQDEQREKNEPREAISAFELNVRRMETLVEAVRGNEQEAMEIVTAWIKEAKRRYDATHG